MEWFEWLLSRESRQFILDHDLFFLLFFFFRFILVTGAEILWPARSVSYRKLVWRDITATIFYCFLIAPLALWFNHWIAIRPNLPDTILAMPLALRFIAYLVVADFGHYWIHRLMHSRQVWRIHQWHHAPTSMYWMAGVRATLPQQILVNLPYIFAWSLFGLAPWWMGLAIGAFSALQNDWMHMNISWRSRWLEWWIVTPRYHHVHHSDNPAHSGKNLAALFTIWDRMFGTYLDPERVAEPLSFGIREPLSPVRLVTGV